VPNLGRRTRTYERGTGTKHRLAAYVVVSLLAGVRTEEARALRWSEVDLEEGTVAVYRSVRAKGAKTPQEPSSPQTPHKGSGGAQRAP
jgi:integrase